MKNPYPSATVILIREMGDNFEVLLLRRNSNLSFHGGGWVFPGGRIDPEDFAQVSKNDMVSAARQAAVREAREEAGILIAPEDLVLISRWTTPEGLPKRFTTWFFVTAAENNPIKIDGCEIDEYCWMRPDQALAAQRAGKIELLPPTFVSILKLSEYHTLGAALSTLARSKPVIFSPRFQPIPGGICCLYEGDAGYEDKDVDRPGARHRLWMLESGWRYELSV